MRKLLDNPYIVGILVVAAIVIIFREPVFTWVKGLKSAPVVASIRTNIVETAAKVRENLPVEQPSVLPDAKIEIQNIQWILRPTRDPFRRVFKGVVEPSTNVSEAVSATNVQLRLSAILIEKEKKFAIINGKVFEEGDSIGGYRIIKIERDFVELEGFKQKRKITFER